MHASKIIMAPAKQLHLTRLFSAKAQSSVALLALAALSTRDVLADCDTSTCYIDPNYCRLHSGDDNDFGWQLRPNLSTIGCSTISGCETRSEIIYQCMHPNPDGGTSYFTLRSFCPGPATCAPMNTPAPSLSPTPSPTPTPTSTSPCTEAGWTQPVQCSGTLQTGTSSACPNSDYPVHFGNECCYESCWDAGSCSPEPRYYWRASNIQCIPDAMQTSSSPTSAPVTASPSPTSSPTASPLLSSPPTPTNGPGHPPVGGTSIYPTGAPTQAPNPAWGGTLNVGPCHNAACD
jgi:hypothetical protein